MTKKSDAPAIRFKGFSDAWEQRKLEDYLTVSVEKNTGNIYGTVSTTCSPRQKRNSKELDTSCEVLTTLSPFISVSHF